MIHMAMVKDVMYGKTMRKSYAKYEEILEIPNMLKIQKDSYQWFLETGLREVFKDVGTITDFSGKLELSFLDYTMEDKPKYTIEECKERDATYAKPIKVRVRLRNTETDEIKEQEIFMGDFPVMTNGGTFVINGAELSLFPRSSAAPACTTATRWTRPTSTPTPLRSFLTAAHGWNTKRTIPTSSGCASTRTASCPSPA